MTILCLGGSLSIAACRPASSPRHSPVSLGSPFSQLCAADNPCPGITEEKLQVCGECDPATRYFRRSICSLGDKMRKAVNSCVESGGGVELSGEVLFGSRVKACVKQELHNEPEVLKSYVAVARGHAAREEEQRAWRRHCERRWAEHRRHKLGGPGAAVSAGSGVGALLLKSRPPDVEVWIDGRLRRGAREKGWRKFQDLAAGEHEVELRNYDLFRLTTTVIVTADKEKKYNLVLKPLPTCNSDADCKGHESGPRCFKGENENRCSCASNADCTDPKRTICRPVWQQAARHICHAAGAGMWCKKNGHCKSGRCKKRDVVAIWGLCQ